MILNFRKFLRCALTLSVLLTGCTYRAPQDFSEGLNRYHENKAAVYVYRPPFSIFSLNSWYASAILLDGTPVCALTGGQWTYFYIDPGQHTIEAKLVRTQSPAYNSITASVATKIQINASASEYYIRINPVTVGTGIIIGGGYGGLGAAPWPVSEAAIELVEPAVGQNEIAGQYVKPGEALWNLW